MFSSSTLLLLLLTAAAGVSAAPQCPTADDCPECNQCDVVPLRFENIDLMEFLAESGLPSCPKVISVNSTCWFQGTTDAACPDKDLCCFDGCKNSCTSSCEWKTRINTQKLLRTLTEGRRIEEERCPAEFTCRKDCFVFYRNLTLGESGCGSAVRQPIVHHPIVGLPQLPDESAEGQELVVVEDYLDEDTKQELFHIRAEDDDDDVRGRRSIQGRSIQDGELGARKFSLGARRAGRTFGPLDLGGVSSGHRQACTAVCEADECSGMRLPYVGDIWSGSIAGGGASTCEKVAAEHCFFFDPVTYAEQYCHDCVPNIEKICAPKQKQVCDTVVDYRCEVVPDTKCIDGINPQQFTYKSAVLDHVVQFFHSCEEGTKQVIEYKDVPRCTKKTKYQCDNEIIMEEWDGNKNCQAVEFDDCELVQEAMLRTVQDFKCQQDRLVKVPTCEIRDAVQGNLLQQSCQIHKSVVCKNVTKEVCKVIEFEDCWDEFSCTNRAIPVPMPMQNEVRLVPEKKCRADICDVPNPEYSKCETRKRNYENFKRKLSESIHEESKCF